MCLDHSDVEVEKEIPRQREVGTSQQVRYTFELCVHSGRPLVRERSSVKTDVKVPLVNHKVRNLSDHLRKLASASQNKLARRDSPMATRMYGDIFTHIHVQAKRHRYFLARDPKHMKGGSAVRKAMLIYQLKV